MSGTKARGIWAVLVAAVALTVTACSSSTTTTGTGGTTTGTAASAASAGTTATTAKAAGTAAGGAGTISVVETPFGKALAGSTGNVLYAWDKETAGGDAVCTQAACLEKWPAFTATSITVADGVDATKFELLPRPDGTKQVAVDGHRLYYMSADAAGEANCQGLEGWYIRNADGSKNTTTTPAK